MWLQLFGEIAKGAGAGLSAQGGYENAMLSSDQAEYEAKDAEKYGSDQAALIRRAGRRVVGSQRTDYAASGVQIGEGSAGQVERETVVDTEHDAFQAILGGQRQALALRTQAKLGRISARASALATAIDPLMASNSGAGSMAGWKTYNPRPALNSGNSYRGLDGYQYANNDLSGTNRGSGD